MALPPDITMITLTGSYEQDDGTPAAGYIRITPSVSALRCPSDDTIIRLDRQDVALVDGSFAVDLIATDDPLLDPSNWYYTITERITDHIQRSWVLQLPYTISPVDVADVASSVDESSTTYAAPVTSVVGETGDVTGHQIIADPTVAAALAAKASTATLVAGYVPYTGATADVDLGDQQIFGHNLGHFEGALTDPVITDNGDGTVSVSGIEVMVRTDPTDPDGHRVRLTVPAVASLAVTDDAINYLTVSYNDGSPIYVVSTDSTALSLSLVPVARFYMESGALECSLVYGAAARSTPARHLYREALLSEPTGARRESGLALGETPTRILTIGSGVVWFVLNRLELDALVMGGDGVESELIYHSGGVWTRTPITQYPNTQYDNGTNLATLNNNQYGVIWVFRSLGANHLGIVLGTGSYTLAEAIASTVPTVPSWMLEFCWLVGRVIVEKGATEAERIENNTAGEMFAGSEVSTHNDLDGLQGGLFPDEYYHLTATEYAGLQAGYVPYTGATSAVDLATQSLYAGNIGYTEGPLSDPTITDAAGTAIAVGQCDALIRSDTDWGGTDGRLYRVTVPAVAELAVTDNAVNYIYIDWNSGDPVYAATTDKYAINGSDLVAVARVAMESGSIEYQMPYEYLGRGALIRTYNWIYKVSGRGGVTRESGLAVSESATRVVTVSSGAAWFGIRRFTLDTVTNGVSGVIMHLWYHSGGVWTHTTITQYPNTQYDDGTDLVILTAGRYGVVWVYRSLVNDEIDVVLGTGNYTLAQAEASTLPAVPELVSAFYVLAGRIIVQKSASTATSIESVTTNTFNQGAISAHEDLSGLQGGTTGEHYHLAAAEYAALGVATSVSAGTPASSAAAGDPVGQVLYDSGYLYVYVGTNTWRRTPLSAW